MLRFLFSTFTCLILFGAPAVVYGEHGGKVQILLLGDSTTEGSVPRRLEPQGPHLEQVIEKLLEMESDLPTCRVINSGVSGEYVRRLIDSGRYDRDVADLPGIDYIMIRYGINDQARLENFVDDFPNDLKELLGRLRKDHANAELILVTNIPYLGPDRTEQVNGLIKRVAEEEDLPVFDLHPGYRTALAQGRNMLNYRRFPLERIPEAYHAWLQPRVHGGRVEVMDNELDAIFGHLPGWYDDRHPNLAGYNVIAVETTNYLAPLLRLKFVGKQADE